MSWLISSGNYPHLAELANPGNFAMFPPYPLWIWRLDTEYIEYPYLAGIADPYLPERPSVSIYPSEAYRAAVESASKSSRIVGAIRTLSGDEYPISSGNIMAGSLYKSCCIASSDILIPGAANSAEYGIKLKLPEGLAISDLYGSWISLNYELWLADREEWYSVPLGSFTPHEVTRASQGPADIIGYDRLSTLGTMPVGSISALGDIARKPYEWLALISAASGIELAQNEADISAMPNGLISLKYNSTFMKSSIKSLWDLLCAVCQLLNAAAFLDRHEKLKLIELTRKEPSRTIRIRYEGAMSSFAFGISTLSMDIRHYSGDRGVEHVEISCNNTGVSAELPENKLLSIGINATPIIDAIGQSLKLAQYRPFDIDIAPDPTLELGEWIECDFGRSEYFVSPITAYKWTWLGKHNIKACGYDTIAGVAKTAVQKAIESSDYSLLKSISNAEALNLGTHEQAARFTHTELKQFTHAQIGGIRNE